MLKLRSAMLLTLALCATAHAQRIPDSFPDSFQRIGTVDDVDRVRIVIDDNLFSFATDVLVHAWFAEDTYITNILKGQTVGYVANDNRQIVELWILPDNYESRTRQAQANPR